MNFGVARHRFGCLHHGQTLAFQHFVGRVTAAQVGQRVAAFGPVVLADVHGQPAGWAEQVVVGGDQAAVAPEVVDLVLNRNMRNQLKQAFDALRELTTPPDPPKRPKLMQRSSLHIFDSKCQSNQ
jgi:hypothetical protein